MRARVNITALTQAELNQIISRANFTDDQRVIFDELNKDYHYDYAIMMNHSIPPKRYYELKKIVIDKTERISLELGYESAINTAKKRL